MKYRLHITFAFDDLQTTEALFARASTFDRQTRTINPNTPREERSTMLIEECHHDDPTPAPCVVIRRWPG